MFLLLCVDVFAPNYPLLYVHEMFAIIFFPLSRETKVLFGVKKEQQNQIKMFGTIIFFLLDFSFNTQQQ